jgi:hypothetical protein
VNIDGILRSREEWNYEMITAGLLLYIDEEGFWEELRR